MESCLRLEEWMAVCGTMGRILASLLTSISGVSGCNTCYLILYDLELIEVGF